MLSTKELISFFIHCAHTFSSIPFFNTKLSFGQTLGGNKHCCIHRLPNSIRQPATLPRQASSRLTVASAISPPPKLLSKKKSGLAKTGKCKCKKKHQELSMPGLCCRAGCLATTLSSSNHSFQQPPAPRAGDHRRAWGSLLTYSVMAFFSEKILRQKSASWCGSNVVGIRT